MITIDTLVPEMRLARAYWTSVATRARHTRCLALFIAHCDSSPFLKTPSSTPRAAGLRACNT